MAKKRVEEEMPDMGNIQLDLTEDTPMFEVPKVAEPKPVVAEQPQAKAEASGPVCCLRDERIIVRFIPQQNSMVQNKNHILSGGMADTATRSFVVPILQSTGQYANVLTKNEKDYLEQVMGLEYNALSVYRKNDNFWDDSNPKGIGKVVLHKQDNYLDLKKPMDYIKYKILLANKNKIASSLRELEDRPKATYQFVIISENAETQMNLSKMDATKRSYMEYGKVEDDKDTLRVIIELLEGRPTAPKTKLDYLQGKVNDYIQENPRRFLSIIKDELLPAKVLIKKALEAGIISKRNDYYYLRKDGTPLCELGEDSTLTNAAKYITNPKRQELKFLLEAETRQE